MTTMTVVDHSQEKVRLLSPNGIAPHGERENQRCALSRDSFLVTKATLSPAVAKFLDFIRRPAGAKVIVANGAVPVEPVE